jgi:hypothetical protein
MQQAQPDTGLSLSKSHAIVKSDSPDLFAKGVSALVLVDVLDRVRYGADFLGRIVRDFDAKLFFESHNQLNDVERISTQIVDEARVFGDLVSLNSEVFDNDLLNPVGGVAHGISLRERQIKLSTFAPRERRERWQGGAQIAHGFVMGG